MAKPMTKSQITDHIAKKAGDQEDRQTMILDEIAKLAYKEARNWFHTSRGIGKDRRLSAQGPQGKAS